MENEQLLEFFREVLKLKKVKRTGWIVSGVKNPESVAEHSFMTALMILILGKKKGINVNKALKMAILHDIAECQIGDIITWQNFHKTEEEKRKIEHQAMKRILSSLGSEGEEYYNFWKEYEDQTTEEARFVKAIDKIEMVLQALDYEEGEKNLNEYINTFYGDDKKVFLTDKDLLEIFEIIKSLRPKSDLHGDNKKGC